MRTHVLAVLAAFLLLLGLGAGTAAASGRRRRWGRMPPTTSRPSSDANATQVAPSNTNTDVRIFSPGNSGNVHADQRSRRPGPRRQREPTNQSATQDAVRGRHAGGRSGCLEPPVGGGGCERVQVKPSNENISVRIKSPGDDGDVDQTNAALAGAAAGNANGTSQSAEQAQGGDGCKCGGGGTQAVGQSAKSKQDAAADANAVQIQALEQQRVGPDRQPRQRRQREPDQRGAGRRAGRERQRDVPVGPSVPGRRRLQVPWWRRPGRRPGIQEPPGRRR